jgi:hypothetical protein
MKQGERDAGMIDLYSEITAKALENEKAGRGAS